jgi:hypothetical protein
MLINYAFAWKRPAVIRASFALTAMAQLLLSLRLFTDNSSRPQLWDASATKGISNTVSQTFDLDEQGKDFIASGAPPAGG